MSLDGYVAGPNGETDWITTDPDYNFGALYKQFDTVLVGRRTFELMASVGRTAMPGMKMIVFSRTLRKEHHPDLLILSDNERETLAALKASPGKDIWLFGGGSLFRSLSEARLVDTVEVSIFPILLGGGTPLLPNPAGRIKLSLANQTIHKGVVSLEYAIL